jgi:tripartite-type tricarboxylate transporter receptor subunit TctC
MRIMKTLATAVIGAIALTVPVLAETFPERPVTIVIGAGPGGSLDTVTRLVAGALSNKWGQPVIVENREGAGHSIAAAYVARAEPDGYTLIMMNSQLTVPSESRKNAGIDTEKSFSPITLVSQNPNILAVNPKVNDFETAKAFFDDIKKRPNGATYASGGVASTNYPIATKLAAATGVTLREVIYEGGGEQSLAVLRGEVDLVTGGSAVMGNVKSGAFRALAVTTAQRAKALPDVPTVAEALGIDGFDEFDWQGLMAPAGAPAAVRELIAADIKAISADAGLQEQLSKLNGNFHVTTPAEFGEFVAKKIAEGEKFLAMYNAKAK